MSVENNILAFVSLVKSQRLYETYETELADLCANLPNDVAQISIKIINWCKSQGLYDELVSIDDSSSLKMGGQKITPQQWIELISNSTRKPLPESLTQTVNHESNQPNPGDSQS